MSRRVATTLTVQVRLRVPPGSSMAAVLGFIRSALCEHKSREERSAPLAALDTDSMIVKLEKKETVYL